MPEHVKKAFPVFGCVIAPTVAVAFLTAAFYPIFTMIRDSTHTISCRDNLKKLGTAFGQYSEDNDGAMPNISDATRGHTWRDATLPYVKLKEVYHCPDRRDDVDADGFPESYAVNYSGDYGASKPDWGKGALAGPGSSALTRTDYPDPAKLILLLEAEGNERPEFNMDSALLFGPQTHKIWFGHFKVHGEFLLADGHTKSLIPANTYQYDPKNHTLFNLWYRNGDTRLSANGVAVLKDAEERFK